MVKPAALGTFVRVCPVCGATVTKTMRYGQVSYDCGEHWGPWEESWLKQNLVPYNG